MTLFIRTDEHVQQFRLVQDFSCKQMGRWRS